MPELTHKLNRVKTGGSNQFKEGYISLDSEDVIKVNEFWRENHDAGEEEADSRLLCLYWNSEEDPSKNIEILREIVLRHEKEYESPEIPDIGEFSVYHKGLILWNGETDREDYDFKDFLDSKKFSSLLTPKLEGVRVCTPNVDFIIDYQPDEDKENRQVVVLTHRNIADLVTDLTMRTSTALMPYQELGQSLENVYKEIMGDNYPVPEKKVN